ncbi:hypothetical protein IMY05_C1151002700 [Salix suchowensis]|nr:hypothetical protein IMY05_C1151002700 [Salix suchowensis]
MHASIPHDTLASIFQWANQSTLRALSLTSSQFLIIADPLLYQHVELRCPMLVDIFKNSIYARGGHRARFVKHLSAEHVTAPPTPLPITLHKLQVSHLILLDRLCVSAVTHLRIDDGSYYPSRSARRSSSLLQNLRVLSSGCTLRSIVRLAPMVPNIDCWELNGDGLALDELNSGRQVIKALASTRVRCLRFVRRSYACKQSFLNELFTSIAHLGCIEFAPRSTGHGIRVYREPSTRQYRCSGSAKRVNGGSMIGKKML